MAPAPRLWSASPLLAAEVIPSSAKFSKYVTRGAVDECWPWRAYRHRGYGTFHIGYGRDGSRSVQAHRAAWVLHTGRDLPADMSIDHLCVNPPCVNPHHLEPVNIHENRRRAKGKAGSPEFVENRVQALILTAEVSSRHPRGQIRRVCPLCGVDYGTDYLADHIRRHIKAGPSYRHRRVQARDGSAWNANECGHCGVVLSGHLRRHIERMHSEAC